ncbi:MAG: putative accessory gene regulator protein [Pelotomaculum sp. PtaB.Bin013]|nr:MAG: putative accessory gene regulator protein [Pelotomaculum sp. PtaB.Bin013]
MNINQLAGEAAAYLTRELALDTGKTDTLRFGLEIIFCIIIKGIILFSLAYLLSILPEVTFALISGSLYRLFSGGAHCGGYLRCLSLGLIVYLGAGELGLYLERYLLTDFLVYLLFAGCSLSSICVIIWAPGEVPFKKITKILDRILFKVLSLASLALWIGASVHFINCNKSSITIAGLIAILTQTFSFSPPGYQAIHKLDSILAGLFKEKEVLPNAADS